jgi:peptide/nickel transport system substrate-binding protein
VRLPEAMVSRAVLVMSVFVLASVTCGPARVSSPEAGSQPSPQASPATAQATASPTAMATPSATPTGPAPTPPLVARRGGTLRIAQGTDPGSCDLHTLRGAGYTSVHPCNPMLSQLVRFAEKDNALIEPDLAESWSSSSDGTEWVFNLRKGVLWHDGSPLGADDVKFSFDRVISPPQGIQVGRAGVIGRYVSKTAQVQAADASTVRIKTDYAASAFLPALANVYLSIYPRRATEKLSPPSMVNFTSVIGTGPFKAASAVRGSSYKLARSDNYYLSGLPYLDGVDFLVMPEPAVRLTALKTGNVDAVAIITEDESKTLDTTPGPRQITVSASPSAGGSTVQMNLSRPPFDDPRVRRAVNLAISRDEADQALGAGIVGGMMPPGGLWSLAGPEIHALPGNGPGGASRGSTATTQAAGAARAEAMGLLADADLAAGFTVKLHVRADPFSQTLADFVAGQLSKVGIKAEVTPVEFVAYQDMLAKRDFAMIAHSHSFAIDDPDFILFDHYACGGVENYPGLCDGGLDEMMARQSRTLEFAERKRLVDQIQVKVWEKDAKVWVQWTLRRAAHSSSVRGLNFGGTSLYQGRRLEQVWLER